MTDINWGLAARTPDYASGAINAFRAGREDRKARVEENAFAKFGQDPNGAINELMSVNPDAALKLRQQQQQDGERQGRIVGATALANRQYDAAAQAYGGIGSAEGVTASRESQVGQFKREQAYMQTIYPKLKEFADQGGDVAGAFETAIPQMKNLGFSNEVINGLLEGFKTKPKETIAGIGSLAQDEFEFRSAGDTTQVFSKTTGKLVGSYQGTKFVSVPDGGKLVPTGGMGGMGGAPGGPSAAPAQAQAQAPAPTGGMYDQVAQIAQANGAGAADVPYLQRLAQVESAGNPGARNGSSTGLFQFHPDTFQSVGGGDINSVADQTKAALALSRRDRAALQQMGVPVTDANTYIMHQQGAGGGKALLTAPPEVNAIAALTPAYGGNAARARQAIVGNGGNEDMTAGEFVNYWQNRWGGAGQGGSQPAPTQQAQAGGSGMNERGDPVGTIYGNPKAPEWTEVPTSESGRYGPGAWQKNVKTGEVKSIGGVQSGASPRKAEADLRKEFNGRPEVKDFREVQGSYSVISRLAKSPPSAPGDLSLIFAFMKMLDPGSVVREGEYATAQNTTGVPDQVLNSYNRVAKGERLNPKQRAEFLAQARNVFESRKTRFDEISGEYRGYADDYGISADRVVTASAATQPQPGKPKGWSSSLTPQQRQMAAKFRGATVAGGLEGNPFAPTSKAEYDALDPGVHYIHSSGEIRVKSK